MIEEQTIQEVSMDNLLENIQHLFDEQYRLIQMNCSRMNDTFCLDYSFDKNQKFLNLRLIIPKENAKAKSISTIYFAACLYENEIHDLFGIDFSDLAVDYKGRFYRIDKCAPFNQEEEK